MEPSGLDIRVEPSEADLRVEPSEAELSLTTAEERATSTLPTKAATYAERKTDEEIEMDVEDVEDVLNKNPEDIEQAISSTGAETNSELACLDPFKQGAALSVDDELTIVHEPNAIIVDDDDKEDERLEEPLVFSGQSSEEENISKTESQPLDSFASTEIHEQVTKVPFQSLDNITPHNQPDIVETVCLTQDALTTQLDDSLRGGDVTSEDVLPTFKQGLQRGSEDASVKAGVQPTEDIVVIQDDAEKGDGENQPSEVQDQIESHATKDDLFDIVDSGDGEDQITVTENLDSKGTTEREEPMLHEQIDSDSEDLVTKPPLGHDTSPETFELQLHDSDSEDNAFVIKTRQSDSLTESSSDLRRETTEPSTSGILETEVPEDVISLVNLRRSPRGSHKDNPVTPEENKATEPSTSGSLETETPEDAISVVNLRRSPRRSHREKSVPVEDATETEDAPPPLNVRQSPRISAKDKSIIVEECLENVISDHALQTLNLRRSPRKHTRDKQIAEEDKITETPNVKPVIVKEPTTTDPYGVSVTDVNAEATDSQTTTDSEATAQEDTLPTFSQRKKRSTRRSSRHMSKITNQATVGPLKVPPSVTRMSASVVKRNSQSAKSVKESKAVDEMPTTLSDLRQKSTDFQALKSHEDLQSEDVLPAFGLRTRSVPRQSLSKIQNSPVVKISPLNYKTKSSDQQKSSKNSEEDESSVLIESESEKEQEVATSTQKPSPSRRSPSRRHRVSSPTKSPSKTSPSKNRRKSYHYPSMRDLTPTSSPLTRSASKKLKKEAKQVETVR